LYFLGIQLTYNEPRIYGSNIPVSLESSFPHLIAAARNKRVEVAPWFHQQEIISLAGQTFYSFAKAGKFDKGGVINRLCFRCQMFSSLSVLIRNHSSQITILDEQQVIWIDSADEMTETEGE
jgi:hypothetical protein